MADVKITALPARSAVATTDILPVVDAAAGTPATQKATVAQVRAALVPIVLTADVSGVLPSANAPSHAGDVTGTHAATVVARVNGATVPASGALTTGNVLQVTGVSALGYAAVNLAGGSNFVTGTLPAANQAAQTLAGDVTGLTSATTVVKVNGASVPAAGALTTGNSAYVSGASALTYGALNLAGGTGWVTGALPVANQAAPTGTGFIHVTTGAYDAATVGLTFTGDTTGTGTAASIALTTVKVNGATVPAAGALTTGNAPYVSGVSALTYSALNLAGGAGWVTGVLPVGNQAAQSLTGDATGTTAAVVNTQARGLKSATTTVAVSAATAPTLGQALIATSSTVATWQFPLPAGCCTLEQFGAVGDGVTSDQTAYAAALTALGAGTYRTIVLGAKTYLVTGGTLPAGCSIVGQGDASILKTTGTASVIVIGGDYCVLKDFKLLGVAAAAPTQIGVQNGVVGSANSGFMRLRISGVSALNFGGAGFLMTSTDGTASIVGPTFTECIAEGCGSNVASPGAGFDIRAEYTNLTNCVARWNVGANNAIGLWIQAGNVTWTGGEIVENGTGVQIENSANPAHGIISATQINHNLTGAFLNGFAPGFRFVGCHIYGNQFWFIGCAGVKFVACVIGSDLVFQGSTGTEFSDCTFTNSGTCNLFQSYSGATSDEQFFNCRDLAGNPFVAGASLTDTNLVTHWHSGIIGVSPPAGATYTELISNLVARRIEYAAGGGIAAIQTITYPTPSLPRDYYEKAITNATTFLLVFKCGAGTQVSVAPGATEILGFKSTGDVVLVATAAQVVNQDLDSADFTTTSLTPVDTGFSFQAMAGTCWEVEFIAKITSTSGNGYRLQWTCPTASTVTGGLEFVNTSASTAVAVSAINTGYGTITPGSVFDRMVVKIKVGTTGTVKLQGFEVSAGTLTIPKGSSMVARRCDTI